MSLENERTGKLNPCLEGEDRRGQAKQQSGPVHRSGGVSGDSMQGSCRRLSGETSPGAPQGATTCPSRRNADKAGRASGGVGVRRSSDEAAVMAVKRRPGTWEEETQRSEGEAMVWETGITMPTKLRELLRVLYRKAKSDSKWRAWSLYGDLCRREILEYALWRVLNNGGAGGVDGLGTELLKESEMLRDRFLDQLEDELKRKVYKPSPVRRVYIPKANGKMRPLGIPTVKDRTVQMAVTLLLMPIYEADFHENSFAYRPKRNAQQAIGVITKALLSGRYEVIDADLSGYFDAIPHRKLMELVAKRVSDGSILALIKAWLEAPIAEEDKETGKKSIKPNDKGTPQGGVISPLLANLYLDNLDKGVNDRCELKPVMVRYADDFVIMSKPGQAAGLMKRLKATLSQYGLKLNEEKTKVKDIRNEGFDFLGFSLRWQKSLQSWKWYPLVQPSQKSITKFRDKIKGILAPWRCWKSIEEVIRETNQVMGGWANYFHYGHTTKLFGKLQWWTEQKLRRWLRKKHGGRIALYKDIPDKRLYAYGLYKLPTNAAWKQAST